jgi:predicted RNase H-like nuclease (RuvC/YqgF family)
MARACTKLTKLRIHELSIVDAGANQGAIAVLMKRDAGATGPTGDPIMAEKNAPTLEDLDKAVKAAEAANATVLAEKAKLEAEKAELQKQLDAANAAAVEKATKEATDLTKRLEDETKARTDLEKRLAQIEDERELAGFVTKAADYRHLPLTAVELAPALRAISKLAPEQAEVITKALGASSEALGKALDALPFVNSMAPAGGAEAEWNGLIQKHMAEAKVDELVATDAVAKTEAGRKAYARMVAEQRPRAN